MIFLSASFRNVPRTTEQAGAKKPFRREGHEDHEKVEKDKIKILTLTSRASW
jgi:hypothetical protein